MAEEKKFRTCPKCKAEVEVGAEVCPKCEFPLVRFDREIEFRDLVEVEREKRKKEGKGKGASSGGAYGW